MAGDVRFDDDSSPTLVEGTNLGAHLARRQLGLLVARETLITSRISRENSSTVNDRSPCTRRVATLPFLVFSPAASDAAMQNQRFSPKRRVDFVIQSPCKYREVMSARPGKTCLRGCPRFPDRGEKNDANFNLPRATIRRREPAVSLAFRFIDENLFHVFTFRRADRRV